MMASSFLICRPNKITVDFGLLCRCLPVSTAEPCGGYTARCARFARSAGNFAAHTQYRLQSVKAGAQAFGKTAVQTGTEPRSSGWFAAENLVLILVFVWCLFGAYAVGNHFC